MRARWPHLGLYSVGSVLPYLLSLHCITVVLVHTAGSGEPIKKSNFRHVRSPVFATKPTCARRARERVSYVCAAEAAHTAPRAPCLPVLCITVRGRRYVPKWAFVDFQHYVRRFSWLRKFFHSIIGL